MNFQCECGETVLGVTLRENTKATVDIGEMIFEGFVVEHRDLSVIGQYKRHSIGDVEVVFCGNCGCRLSAQELDADTRLLVNRFLRHFERQ